MRHVKDSPQAAEPVPAAPGAVFDEIASMARGAAAPLADDWFDMATEWLVETVLSGDTATLLELLEPLRAVHARLLSGCHEVPAARARALLVVAMTAVDAIESPLDEAPAPGTVRARFLRALTEFCELNSSVLADRIRVHPTEVSRTGGRLVASGAVRRVHAGRETYWYLTPRGRQLARAVADRQGKVAEPERLPTEEAFRSARRRRRRRAGVGDVIRPIDVLLEVLAEERRRADLAAELLMWESFGRFAGERAPDFHVPEARSGHDVWSDLAHDLALDLDLDRVLPNAPKWGGYALVKGEEGKTGVMLLDVPSSVESIDGSASSPDIGNPIAGSGEIAKAFRHLGLPLPQVEGPGGNDLVRRLMVLYYLRDRCGVPSWIARMCVVAPPSSATTLPTSCDDWEAAHERICSDLHLPPQPLRQYWRNCYIPAALPPLEDM